MTKKLLILSDRHGYYKFSSGSLEHCSMEKATVFPIDKIDEVRNKQAELRASGLKDVAVKLLTITEEEYIE